VAPKRRNAQSLLLSEHMSGWIAEGDLGPEEAETRGRGAGTIIEHDLTIVWEDGRALLSKPSVFAGVQGTVIAPILSRERLQAAGTFQLLVHDPSRVETRHMKYDLVLVDVTGQHRYRLFGEKTIAGTGAYRPWHSATTLPFHVTRILPGDAAPREETVSEASGVLHLSIGDLVRMLTSVDAEGGALWNKWVLVARFTLMFARSLLRVYGGPFDEFEAYPGAPADPVVALGSSAPESRTTGPSEPSSTLPEPTAFCCGGSREAPSWQPISPRSKVPPDAWLKLTRYAHPPVDGETPKQMIMAHAFAMSSQCFDHIKGATLQNNLATTLYEEGYDVWLFDYEASIDLPSSGRQFTLDDVARYDWPTGVEKVLKESDSEQVDVFAHCIGSASFLMAMLGGHLDGKVRAAVCSQAGIFLQTSLLCLVRSYIPFGSLLQKLDIKLLQPPTSPTPSHFIADLLLRLIPVPRGERCELAICRWLNAIYAMSYRHAQLDDATHEALHVLIRRGNLEALDHVNRILRLGQLVDSNGRDVYVNESGAHHLASVSFLFLQGDDNYLFKPPGSFKTREWLERHNPGGIYRRVVLEGYAHLDVILGRTADVDVFPTILEFLSGPEGQSTDYPNTDGSSRSRRERRPRNSSSTLRPTLP
jgi:cholesterol oxidase